MEDSPVSVVSPLAKRIAISIAAAAIGTTGIGYVAHEHHVAKIATTQAQTLSVQNQQMTAELNATRSQMGALSARVNDLTASAEKPSPSVPAHETQAREVAAGRHVRTRRARAQDERFNKLQGQVDAQGKEIDATRGDLANTRTELTGSIARTHAELVTLEKKGERNYFEFDIVKSKQFKREGPLSVSLKKTNVKHQYADLMLIVDDRNLTQKHVNLYQPVMYYQPQSQQPVEVVINAISKDHIHGYVSAPKYQPSELASAPDADANPVSGPNQAANGDQGVISNQAANPSAQPPARQRLTLSPSDYNAPQF